MKHIKGSGAFAPKASNTRTSKTVLGRYSVPLKHMKQGNFKIDRSCLITSLPTHVCFGEGNQCKKCYAARPEKRYPTKVLAGRERHLKETLSYDFVEQIIEELKHTRKKIVRLHESGDFYSQVYVNKWTEIIKRSPERKFYFWTKKDKTFDFTELQALPNVNMMVSRTANGGLNYGNKAYVNKLVAEEGFFLCPCKRGVHNVCMSTCFECLTTNKVCFIGH